MSPFIQPVRRTREEVATILESFLAGRVTAGGWDYFISVPIEDAELDRVRQRCDGLHTEFPSAAGEYCNSDGREVMQVLIAKLRT